MEYRQTTTSILRTCVYVALAFVSPLLLSQALIARYLTGSFDSPPVTLVDILTLCLICVLGGLLGTFWVMLRPTLSSLPWTFLWWALYFLAASPMGFDAGDAGATVTRQEAMFMGPRYFNAGLVCFGFFLVTMTACFVSFLKTQSRQ